MFVVCKIDDEYQYPIFETVFETEELAEKWVAVESGKSRWPDTYRVFKSVVRESLE